MTFCENCNKLVAVSSACCGAPTEFVDFKGNTCNKCGQRTLDVCAICGSTKLSVE